MKKTVIVSVLATFLLALNVRGQQPPAATRVVPDSVPLNWTSGPYFYDGSGNIVSIGPGSFGKIDVHVYDAFGRLVSTSANTASHTNTQSIMYDRHGNITRIDTTSAPGTQSAVTETVVPLVNDATNRLRDNASACGSTVCPTGTYDEAGNQLTSGGGVTYGYDALGMMKEASSASGRDRYIYDSNGERIATVHLTPGAQPAVVSREVTLRRTDGKVVRAFTDLLVAGSHTWKWQEDYVYRGSLLLAAVVPDGATEKREHFHLDHLGTPRLITDDRGVRLAFHTYLPFGVEAPGSDYDTEVMKFTGHERSASSSIASGLDYMHARFYGGAVGRFLSMDPTWDSADEGAPQTWNRYTYVRNSPIGRMDPTGTVDWSALPDYLYGVGSAFATDLIMGVNRPEPTSHAMAAGQVVGDLMAVHAGSQEVMGGGGIALGGGSVTVLSFGTSSPLTVPAAGAGLLIAGHGATVVGTATAHLIHAGMQMSSVNQMNKEVKKGQAPRDVKRVDAGKVKGEQDHVHFNDKKKSALNKDGTWKHGNATLKQQTLDWLKKNGWTLP